MADLILTKDTEAHFPHVTVLKASAGSGKTHTLTKRFVQFLLSGRIPANRLTNVLAITFSNNAAKEMKERTLSWLKEAHFGDREKLDELLEIASLAEDEMRQKAGLLIGEILDNYPDFQVKTIDSFMATVFKASAIDFGYNPDFDILMSNDSLMEYSFDLFLRNVKEGTAEAAYLGDIVDFLLEQKKATESYIWDPSGALLDEIKKIYRRLSSKGKRPEIEDFTGELNKTKEKIGAHVELLDQEIEKSGIRRSGNSSYRTILPLVREKRFPDLIGKGFANPPVNKPQKGKGGEQASYDRVLGLWGDLQELISRYTVMFTRSRCVPYVKAYQSFNGTLEMAKRQQGKVFIEDINMQLAEYLSSDIVPDVYFRIGETIFHFLIDEFQDTSPIQWKTLFPLVENSLAQGGSLFAVGDTKQAIYGFRNADYAIMKGLEEKNPFPSAEHSVKELDINYRSRKRILEFNERVFKERLPLNADYKEAGNRSGLTEYVQKPKEGEVKEGYVEVSLFERNDEEPAEKEKIQEIVGELLTRGYRYGDIAVLAQTNEDAVRVSGWLNEKDIPFISYSSLDVRRRRITGEIVALMNFLDSPMDDFSFGTFLLGEVFTRAISEEHPETGVVRLREFCFGQRRNPPLYKAFQEKYGSLWKGYFDELFKASGFLPVYDLVTEVFAVFKVFENLPEEEAALVKILEVVKDFEGRGFNNLKDFLATALDDGDGEAEWEMAVPKNIDAAQVMTVHKAKGMGFPVVIILLYEIKNRGFEYIVEEKGETVCLLKINKDTAACDEILEGLYEGERMRDQVNRLNSLYVGFTRPKSELYVVGVKKNDKSFPFVLIPSDEFPPSVKPLEGPGGPSAEKTGTPPACPLLHRHGQLAFPASPEEFMTLEERRRGEFIHRVLSLIGYLKDGFEGELIKVIERVKDEGGADYPADEIKGLVMALIGKKEMSGYFMEVPGRKIWMEKEFSDASGRLFRMDRVVIDSGSVTVIDYKTGKSKGALEKYLFQMRNYMRILGDICSGTSVKGVIAFIDLGEVEEIG
ncbi:MAG: UvrD-helicase domain-containing protein [Thermodesulfovibrionales bacterium]|jgi:ATP-dependent exoDNAse (exonuclease V) beta subunit